MTHRPSKKQKLIRAAGSDGYWAHTLWQRHGLRPEEYDAMPRRRQLFYIASELVTDESGSKPGYKPKPKGGED